MYDAIVVGARCTGAPTAMLLARRGYRVLLLDRDRFPSDAISTHFIWPGGVRYLHEWGLLDRVLETNCPPVRRSITQVDGATSEEVFEATRSWPFGLCPRRILLDKVLVDAAVEAGVELRQGCSVRDLVWEDGRVVGVAARDDGHDVTERARIVIGADGLHSRIAALVSAEEYERVETLSILYYAYFDGVPLDAIELYAPVPGEGGSIGMPTNDGRVIVGTGFPRSRADAIRKDIEAAYLRVNERAARPLWERLVRGRRVSPFKGMVELPFYARVPSGPGWALVGDAGYHVDPTLGYGISNGFRQVPLLADALDDALSGRRAFDDAMSDFQRARDEALRPYYAQTLAISRAVAGVA